MFFVFFAVGSLFLFVYLFSTGVCNWGFATRFSWSFFFYKFRPISNWPVVFGFVDEGHEDSLQ